MAMMAMTTNNSISVKPGRFHDENVLEINGKSPDCDESQVLRKTSAATNDLGDSAKVNETNHEPASTSLVLQNCFRTLWAEEQAERTHRVRDLALTRSKTPGSRDYSLRDRLPE